MVSFLAKVSRVFILFISMVVLPAQAADEMKLVLKLDSIEKKDVQEERGDELYFNITEYSSVDAARHYQVPDFPTHWLSPYLENVKDVSLWKKSLIDGESVELIVSLVERDVPPWNVDDLLGSVKLKLKWENNKLQKQWSIPNEENTSFIDNETNEFAFTGDDGNYHLKLHVKQVADDL